MATEYATPSVEQRNSERKTFITFVFAIVLGLFTILGFVMMIYFIIYWLMWPRTYGSLGFGGAVLGFFMWILCGVGTWAVIDHLLLKDSK